MQTIKIKYEMTDPAEIQKYLQQYSNCLHYMYNRVEEGKSEKECRQLSKGLNNIELLDAYMIQCAIKEAVQLNLTKKDKVVFGGKSNFIKRCKNKISKDEFKQNRLALLYVIGEATHYHGNRKFSINEDLKTIIFKPSRKHHFELQLPELKKNHRRLLKKLYEHSVIDDVPITFKLSMKYVYISFEEDKIFKSENKQIKDRVLGIDLNPNYVGWSIVDWKASDKFKVVKTGIYSFKELNDKEKEFKKKKIASTSKERIYLNNKRRSEVFEVVKNLIGKAKVYRCSLISIEDLSIRSSDKQKGKRFNRLCNNQWLRNDFVNALSKRCKQNSIQLLKVVANYSSFIGNMMFRELKQPDMVNASIELGRRGYEFNHQYILKDKEKIKNIVQPRLEDFNDMIVKSLEEFGFKENFSNLINLYYAFKNSKMVYRVPIPDSWEWFKLKTRKSNIGTIDLSIL